MLWGVLFARAKTLRVPLNYRQLSARRPTVASTPNYCVENKSFDKIARAATRAVLAYSPNYVWYTSARTAVEIHDMRATEDAFKLRPNTRTPNTLTQTRTLFGAPITHVCVCEHINNRYIN